MAIQAGETTFYQAKRGIVQDGLVLNLDPAVKQSYDGSGTTWSDLSVGNNATLVNGPTFSKDNGGVLEFDGTNDRADLSLPYDFTAYSMFFFIKRRSPQSGWYFAIDTLSPGVGHLFTFHSTAGSANNIAAISPDGLTTIHTGLPIGQWNYYGATWDGSTVTGYKDGASVSTVSNSTGFNLTNRVGIAARYGGGYNNNVIFGSIVAYNRALTATEVLQNYNATRHRFGV